ncbi:PepSY domain-containing protein [Luteolibacter flavescens]|uniref:PepSY domain-containing protein n=1 Tax=Luteolibacter flavescens TaxID=1859460 RepID=A0ABT3FKP2_9BACT|nr:PepSY-associated TM helix domain-containing protein [Luteolibacter flavescens]MCW1884153.1 PepSY domain-containing protein [Luteolibacter flavescens]
MRKLFWKLHSVVGLMAGLGLLVIGITGSLLVFHQELDAVISPEATRVEPVPEGRMPLEKLVVAVEQQVPGHGVTGWELRRDDPRAAEGAYVMPHGTRDWHWVTVDPYRGTVLSRPRDHDATLKGWLLELHKEFFLHDIGIAVTGLLGVALCFLGGSGLYLYRRFWKSLFRLRLKSSFRMLSGDFHRLVGVWSTGFNLLLGFTGAYWNVSHTIEHLVEPHHDAADEVLFYEKLFSSELPIEAMLTDAKKEIPGFEARYVSLPWAPGGPFTLWGSAEDAAWFRSEYGSQVAFDSKTGAVISKHDLTKDGWWTQVVDSFEPLHFGNFGGLTSKILWSAAGLAPALLCLSGMAIWWQRHRKPGASPAAKGRK